MGKIITPVLPHDLPENWTDNQYVSPGGTEAGLTEQHGFNYLMKQVNNAQIAINELDNGSAPYGLVHGMSHLHELSAFDSTILGLFNSMEGVQIKNFYFNCNVSGAPLEGGAWYLNITKIDSKRGTILATKYSEYATDGGIMIKTCSIHEGMLTSWKSITGDGVMPASLE